MKRCCVCLSAATLTLLALAQCAAGQESPQDEQGGRNPADPVVVVPAQTAIPLALKNTISSRTAFVGQAIYCETIYPITVGNRIVIPVGSYVKGTVTQVVRPGRLKGKAKIGLRFDSLTLPNGTTRPLRATLSSYGGDGNQGFQREEGRIEGEGTKGEDAARIGTTATQGAILGGVAARSGKGAGLGALTGGVGGLIWVLATRGREVLLPPGTSLELQLSTPLSFDRDEVEPPSRYDDGPALPPREPGPA